MFCFYKSQYSCSVAYKGIVFNMEKLDLNVQGVIIMIYDHTVMLYITVITDYLLYYFECKVL